MLSVPFLYSGIIMIFVRVIVVIVSVIKHKITVPAYFAVAVSYARKKSFVKQALRVGGDLKTDFWNQILVLADQLSSSSVSSCPTRITWKTTVDVSNCDIAHGVSLFWNEMNLNYNRT